MTEAYVENSAQSKVLEASIFYHSNLYKKLSNFPNTEHFFPIVWWLLFLHIVLYLTALKILLVAYRNRQHFSTTSLSDTDFWAIFRHEWKRKYSVTEILQSWKQSKVFVYLCEDNCGCRSIMVDCFSILMYFILCLPF